eukprot:2120989-Pleurochrysis_carterae.AAC.1
MSLVRQICKALRKLHLLLRALSALGYEYFLGQKKLERQRLDVKVHSVDRVHISSIKGAGLRAFTDGTMLQDGRLGISVFYHHGHDLNSHG